MIDWTLNIPTIFAIVGALGWLFRMEARGRANATAITTLDEEVDRQIEKLEKEIEKLAHMRAELSILKDALHAQELYAARTFATKDGVTDALNRMEKALEGLTSRFDRFAVAKPQQKRAIDT